MGAPRPRTADPLERSPRPTPVRDLRDELRDVPAIAICATCGDVDCPGHDFELSGERPIRRFFSWEDGKTPSLRALWGTSIASATDLELWVRASLPADQGVVPAFTFALACEVVAVLAVCLPLGALGMGIAWRITHSLSTIGTLAALLARIGAGLVPLMIVIHVVHQTVLARAGNRLGKTASRAHALRAGLYACGWDLATGPAGILASLVVGEWREAKKRAGGNQNLFREATSLWLRSVHGVEGRDAERARRSTLPWMVGLLFVAVVIVGWAVVATL